MEVQQQAVESTRNQQIEIRDGNVNSQDKQVVAQKSRMVQSKEVYPAKWMIRKEKDGTAPGFLRIRDVRGYGDINLTPIKDHVMHTKDQNGST